MTKKFNAFTLAEVLITLGIIGVVAAMTMPTLINQTNGAQYRAAYKKALSAISQGVTLNVALDDISFADTVKGTAGSTATPDDGTSVASLLKSRMNIVKESSTAGYTMTGGDNNKLEIVVPTGCSEEGKTIANCPAGKLETETQEKDPTSYFDTFLFFNDSSMIAFKNDDTYACTQTSNATNGNKTCVGLIDVNGAKGPNKFITCDGDTGTSTKPCEVKSPTDIYPVIFYDQTILPANDAGKAVLYGK